MTKKHFIVTCHGWSASNWTAHALNLNPNIVCTHSARNEIAKDKDLQSNQNLKRNINQLQKGYLLRQKRSLDALYDEIERKAHSNCYGSVHVLRMRDIPIITEEYGVSKRNFKIANIVRHPVDLVWSGYGQFKDLFRYDINELYWTTGKIIKQGLEFVNNLSEKYDLYIGDYEVLAFLGACSIIESLKLDLMAYDYVSRIDNIDFVGTFQMEMITSKEEYFTELLNSLDLKDFITETYLEEVFETGIINKHKSDSRKIRAKERYEYFLPWQKEAFKYFFNLHDIEPSYNNFGYDLSFIN